MMSNTPRPDENPDASVSESGPTSEPSSPPERLRRENVQDLLTRLIPVARRYYLRVLQPYRGAPEPLDLIQQAVADLLDGTRTWPPDVDAFRMLYGIIRSRASNYAARQRPVGATRSHRSAREKQRFAGLEEARPPVSNTEYTWNSVQSPDARIMDRELRQRVRTLVSDDEELSHMVEILLENPDCSAAELASRLGTSVRAIYNARKRLRRRLKPVQP